MNNKEALKILLEGKQIVSVGGYRYKLNDDFFLEECTPKSEKYGKVYSIQYLFANPNTVWEEYKEPYKIINEFIKMGQGAYGKNVITNTLDSLPDNKTYRVTIEEIIE